jgi:uncharacterized protein (TIGR00661 family)
MKEENFNIPELKPRVLVAPLDWGLGHATRCIPIICTLIQQNCKVVVAAEGQIKILLQKEFPGLDFIDLKGYRVQYSRYKFWMPFKLLTQFPKILFRIYAENRWLKKIVKEYNIDAVISDNRMGLYHRKILCVYITHQLTIKTGSLSTERIAQKIHYHFINKFTACWVPDAGGALNLAGELSHPSKLPKTPISYLGPLSRFEIQEAEATYDLTILLSGPEPQRSILEKKVLKDLNYFKGKVMLVRALPGETPIPTYANPCVEIKNHLPATELNQLCNQSKIIIGRCGYSTVMDLVKLNKNAILVPTPGQTEQEYLARYLHEQKLFFCVNQNDFSVADAIKNAVLFMYNKPALISVNYKNSITQFVEALLP